MSRTTHEWLADWRRRYDACQPKEFATLLDDARDLFQDLEMTIEQIHQHFDNVALSDMHPMHMVCHNALGINPFADDDDEVVGRSPKTGKAT